MIILESVVMSIFDYIDKYGNSTFEEVSFNEVDNVILSSLSYVSFYGIVSGNRHHKITIREAGDKYTKLYPHKKKYIWAVKMAVKMLSVIKNTKRYGDLLLYNYVYEWGSEQQFSALTIELNPNLVYVSFEGTDHLVSGWKEDFMMTYKFPVKSQKRAIEYINRNFFFNKKEIILGGHSKGGNLAMVSSMFCNFWIRNKIIKIYNNDGPGLLKEVFESKQYDNIKSKLVSIIPNYSVVGMLLYHDDNYIVVKSSKKGAMAHDLYNWVVDDTNFVRDELDFFNKSLSLELINWLKKYSRDERRRFVFSMFNIFEEANVISLIELISDRKLIMDVISASRDLDDVDVEMFKDLVLTVVNCFKDVKVEEFKTMFDKKKVLK